MKNRTHKPSFVKCKLLTLIWLTLLLATVSFAQTIAPQSVNCSGTTFYQSNGNLSFTVGEIAVLTYTDSLGNALGSGFTAAATLIIVNIQESDPDIVDLKVFPNPTTDLINIQINQSTIDAFVIKITDLEGKEVYSGKYLGGGNTIGVNTSSYSEGTYILSIMNKNHNKIATYKIIKQFVTIK